MIKKYLFVFFATCFSLNAYAVPGLYRFPDEDVVYKIIIDSFEKYADAYTMYHDKLKKNSYLGITAQDIWEICSAGGLDINTQAGIWKCRKFKNELIQNNYKYYNVCEDKDKSGGTEHCISEFSDIEVQYAQAKNLAVAYAKERFGDDIVCSKNIRSSSVTGRQDYIACTSTKNKKIYYEFEFDDTQESGALQNRFVYREFARGLCLVYGGKPDFVVGKSEQILRDQVHLANFDVKCKSNDNVSCDYLASKIQHLGYKVKDDGTMCKISYDLGSIENSSTGFSDKYYAKFDGNNFTLYYNNQVFKSWRAVSGRGKTPTDERPTICQQPKYQSCGNVGPTPSGKYFINQNDIQYLENFKTGSYEESWKYWLPSTGRRDRQMTSFGASRVLLNPYSDTETYDRTNMYVHGGRFAGSAGCIDLVKNINEFINWFAQQTEFSSMDVIVDYADGNTIVCNNTCSTDAKECTPCRCITSDEVAEKCTYL